MIRNEVARWMGIFLACVFLLSTTQAKNRNEQDTVFQRSLHSTAKGMSYWYDKSNDGLESVTGVPYSQLTCQGCHVASCDRCHLTKADGKVEYSTQTARKQEMCLECHARETSILKIDRQANQVDVHVAQGMTCMDCHTAREMHGDGVEYISMKQPGATDAGCERCHTPKPSLSHTAHKGTVDCKACHDRHVVSCTNCHFETLVQQGKRVAIPVSGWVFLMNLNGKVTSATVQSFVVKGKKTFLMFAPQHSHSVMAKGRTCKDCHATEVTRWKSATNLVAERTITEHERGHSCYRECQLGNGLLRAGRGQVGSSEGCESTSGAICRVWETTDGSTNEKPSPGSNRATMRTEEKAIK
jgi:hypothetical protein